MASLVKTYKPKAKNCQKLKSYLKNEHTNNKNIRRGCRRP